MKKVAALYKALSGPECFVLRLLLHPMFEDSGGKSIACRCLVRLRREPVVFKSPKSVNVYIVSSTSMATRFLVIPLWILLRQLKANEVESTSKNVCRLHRL